MSSNDDLSNRQFQIWSYKVSHSQLLLRSTKSENYLTRVDLLFKNVAIINIPTFLKGVRIDELVNDHPGIPAGLDLLLNGRRFYEVKSEALSGYIVAGSMTANVDVGEYDDPSPLLP